MRVTTILSAILPMIFGTVTQISAQQTVLGGTPGLSTDYNAAWLNLRQSRSFSAGQRLRVHFIGSAPTEVIGRFVEGGCSFSEPCSIMDQCHHFPVVNGIATLAVDHNYTNIIQISVHSGVSGLAWHCTIDGGPMRMISQIELIQ